MKRDQIPLFDVMAGVPVAPSLDELIDLARASYWRLFEQNIPCLLGFSGGKDSSVCTDLALTTARDYLQQTGRSPFIVVTMSDTLIENPEITEHAQSDLRKISAFGKTHGLRIIVKVAKPSLLNTWQMKVLTGRGLPSFPGANADCSQDLKIIPQQKLRAKLLAELENKGMEEPVTCLGLRHLESEKRSLAMMLRGDNSVTPMRNKDGDLVLSPIADWQVDDVFEYLATRTPGASYSDFKDTLRIYAHSEGQSCAIVASAIQEGLTKRKKGGCGARHGCFLCQQAEDKSLANMIAFDERYSYASGLNKLNIFIRNTRFDWRRRNWIGRTLRAGWVKIQPDTNHPGFIRELFRYMLQLDYDEKVRAKSSGQKPKFQMFNQSMVLALDAYWSLTGLAQSFSAWADYFAIYSGEVRYDIPAIEQIAATPIPDARFMFVGDDWESQLPMSEFQGLRDPYLESLLETSACAPALKEMKKTGRMVWDLPQADSFSVDAESLAMIMDFEIDGLLEMHRSNSMSCFLGSVTYGFKWYVQYGVIAVHKNHANKIDEMLRRSAHKESIGLGFDFNIDELVAKSVRFADLPVTAREAWSAKATTSSAQEELDWIV